jgi:hypothetical protein
MLGVATLLAAIALSIAASNRSRPVSPADVTQGLETAAMAMAFITPNVLIERAVAKHVTAERTQIALLIKEVKLQQNELEQQVSAQIASFEREYGNSYDGIDLEHQRLHSQLDALVLERPRVQGEIVELVARSRQLGFASRVVVRCQLVFLDAEHSALQESLRSLARYLGTHETPTMIYVLKDRERRLRARITIYQADIQLRESRLANLLAPAKSPRSPDGR